MTVSVRTLLAIALISIVAQAQAPTLLFSTSTDQAATPVPIYDEEVHGFDGTSRFPVLTHECLLLTCGDANGNGVLDDAPVDIDAIHASGLAEPGGLLLSVTADTPLAGGITVKDGDIFRFTATGVDIVYPESLFEAATGTTNVDLDAFAIGPNGDLYFSFADDETTTNAALIAQNGGSGTLSKQVLFRLPTGTTLATIHLIPSAAVSIFNAAFGATATTIVNLTDVEIDPAHPGELLLTCASTAAAFRGKVASTNGGGQPFTIGGQVVSPATLGLSSTASLDGLALTATPRAPVVRAVPGAISAAAPVVGQIIVQGLPAGESVQLVTTDVLLPRPAFVPLAGATGYGASPLQVSSPMFAASFSVLPWRLTADATGTASYSFDSTGVPAGITAVVQAIGLTSLRLSGPAVVSFRP